MENNMENTGKTMDILIERMENDKELQMKKQEVLKEHTTQVDTEKAETPKKQIAAKIIRTIMRPFLHLFIEIFGVGVVGGGFFIAISVFMLALMQIVAHVSNMAGIQANSSQEVVLVLATSGTALYVFISEGRKMLKKLECWTKQMHEWV